MIETDLMTLKDACARLPGQNGRVHINTVRRWVSRRGCRGVRLKAVRCGGRLMTKQAWIDQFITDCTEQSMAGTPVADAVAIQEADQRATAILRRFGLDG